MEKPVSRSWFTNELKRQSKKILGKEIHAHQLRHSFATLMLRNGERLELVSRYLGHSSVNITAKYYQHDKLSADSLKARRWKFTK